MGIFDHPGNLGAVRGTLLTALHANWPAYPQGENFLEPLFQLTAFPEGTEFLVIDDIDQALLLLACIAGTDLKDKFNETNLHIAVWHEDLNELQKKGFIDGIKQATEQEWHEFRWQQVQSEAGGKPIGVCNADGDFVQLKGPAPEEYDDESDYKPFAISLSGRITVTNAGRDFVRKILSSQEFDIAKNVSAKVQRLFELKFFDTCIREACVQLEHEMKTCVSSDAYGDRLINAFIKSLRNKKSFLESQIRTFRQEIRTLFKLIRNNYMHNLSEADEAGALAILVMISRARSMFT